MLLNNISLFWEFLKVGTFTLGGGVAMIPQIQDVAVNEKKWMTEEEMLDCIAVAQSLPGVVAVNTATYVGYRKGGLQGAISATVGVALPAFIAIILAITILGKIGDNKYVTGAFTGIKAGVCGLIVVTAIRMFGQIVKDKTSAIFSILVCVASLVAVSFFSVTAVIVILASILAGIIYSCVRRADR